MYNTDVHSVRSGNIFTLTLTTPVAWPNSEQINEGNETNDQTGETPVNQTP